MLVALLANVGVGVAKAVGGIVTGSSALLAEAAHSVADTLNEVFLLLSLGRAERPADRTHPFGYGKERFFWSLLAAVGIFLSGAVFSVAEGVSSLRGEAEPTSTKHFVVIYAILGLSLVLEGGSLLKALRQVTREAATARRRLLTYVVRSPDPTVKTVASEDSIAVLGVLVALAGTVLHQVTGSAVWDGVSSITIGLLLAVVAFLLGRDTKELLIGEAADPAVRLEAVRVLGEEDGVVRVQEVLTMQLGPSNVLVAGRVQFAAHLDAGEVERICTRAEEEMRRRVPTITQVFLDPSAVSESADAAARERWAVTEREAEGLLDPDRARVPQARTRTGRTVGGR
ncbi:cation diffusion facilitator family transporter [Kineococcus rhizosphaerae]|uniref:Cation diffusion facilitator family transporter n=1 Tax=Kineococcus rhizosphaerae TaxID=559628 RepID=A0A2T0R2B8_9ACTN|nr:cation diffusion facilitator family transporter [Kineococcus rhizosphaerae]